MTHFSQSGNFTINNVRVEPEFDQLVCGDVTQKLEPKIMQVLLYLAHNRNHIVSIDELLEHIWSETVVTPQTPQRCISLLRKTLSTLDSENAYIVTYSKRGYQLAPEPVFDQGEEPKIESAPTPKQSTKTSFKWGLTSALFLCLLLIGTLVWLLPPQSQVAIELPQRLISTYAVHPNEEDMAYLSRDDNEVLKAYLRRGSNPPVLIRDLQKAADARDLAWSPSGKQLAIAWRNKTNTLMLFDYLAEEGKVVENRILLQDSDYRYVQLKFLDENHLLLARALRQNDHFELLKLSLKTGDLTPVVPHSDVQKFDIQGLRIVYQQRDFFQYRLHFYDLANEKLIDSYTVEKRVKELALSPDGHTALYKTAKGLFLYRPQSEPVAIETFEPEMLSDVQFSPSGDELYYIESRTKRALLLKAAGEYCCQNESRSVSADHYEPRWAPDGKRYAYISEQTGSPQVWLNHQGQTRQLTQFDAKITEVQRLRWSPDGQWLLFKANKDIYAYSFVMASANAVVTGESYVHPLGFGKTSDNFYYSDFNAQEVKIVRQSLLGKNKRAIELDKESQFIVANGELYFKPFRESNLYRLENGQPELITAEFPKDATFMGSYSEGLLYQRPIKGQKRNVYAYDLAQDRHELKINRLTYRGEFQSYHPSGGVLAEHMVDTKRQLFKLDTASLDNQ